MVDFKPNQTGPADKHPTTQKTFKAALPTLRTLMKKPTVYTLL
jgi:hypothetical protein